MGEQKQIYTDKEASEYLRISQVTLWRERKKGKIDFRRIGAGKLVYTREDLENYLERSKRVAFGAREMFANWLSNREGSGGSDAENAVRQVRLFLEQHGQSRFQSLPIVESDRVFERVGYKRKNNFDETEFLIFPENFRAEVCKGLDAKFVAAELAERSFLVKGSDGKNTRNERIDGRQQRFYILSGSIFEATEKSANEEKQNATA